MKSRIVWRGLFLCLLVPALASAGAIITISDLLEGPPVIVTSGFDPNTLSIQNLPEQTDVHGEYVTISTFQPGVAVVVNFNFIEPVGEGVAGSISDTLNVTFTGHTPTTLDPSNLSVDLHFRSEVEGGTALPPLANAISILETGLMQNLTSSVVAAGGPSDFSLSAQSDVIPEPSTWGLMLIGAAGIVLGKLRRLR